MKTSQSTLRHTTRALLLTAAVLTAPAMVQAGQTASPADPPRRLPESGDGVAFDLRGPIDAMSSALREAHEQLSAQRRSAEARAQGEQRGRESQWDAQYERARQAIERAQWVQAVQQFTQLAGAKAPRADAAMYWRAYALDKMNRHADALSAVGDLFKSFPTSRWAADARALELQVRQRAGQPVTVDTGDDELKLLAIQGLQQTAPERAVPLLVKVISEVGSLRLKERALFVLSQSGAPEARATIEKVARGGGNPELQVKAVQYIAMSGRPERVTLLNSLYVDGSDVEVKRQVLRAFGMAGDRQRVLNVALTEKAPELRTEAVQQLGMLGAREELWQMYQKEPAVEVKRSVLTALAMSGATPRMTEVVTTERNPELRNFAVRQLGMMGGKAGADTLVNLYGKESEVQVRRAVIEALSFQRNNADMLVTLARKESNPELRRELVRRLSFMGTPGAIEYLTEILEK
jgi:HEAT repeat protein